MIISFIYYYPSGNSSALKSELKFHFLHKINVNLQNLITNSSFAAAAPFHFL